jgi:hypothetical protein
MDRNEILEEARKTLRAMSDWEHETHISGYETRIRSLKYLLEYMRSGQIAALVLLNFGLEDEWKK